MSTRTEAERTLRARVMALDATAQEVLLAYLAGTARQAVESGLEFMTGTGLLDETADTAEGSPAEIGEAAGDGGSPDQAATPASGPRPLPPARGPHLRAVTTFDEVRRAGHYEPGPALINIPDAPPAGMCAECGAAPAGAGGCCVSCRGMRRLREDITSPVVYLGCGHSMTMVRQPPPLSEVTCPGCGPTLTVEREDWHPASAGAS